MRDDVLFCLIGDDRFLPGLTTLLASLGRHVPGFAQYPLKVYYDDAISPFSPASRDAVRRLAPQAVFQRVARPEYRRRREPHRASYLTLEIFLEPAPRWVCFLDSDLLCVGDFTDMFRTPGDYDFIACEAGRAVGGGRWADRQGRHEGRWGRRRWLGLWGRRKIKINTGMFAVGPRCRGEAVHRGLLRTLARRRYAAMLDQWVINQYFGTRRTSLYLLPNEYNWRVWEQSEEPELERQKIIHYSGYTHRPKPWAPDADPTLPAVRLWRRYARLAERAAA